MRARGKMPCLATLRIIVLQPVFRDVFRGDSVHEFNEFLIEHRSGVITGIEQRGAGTPIVLLHGVGGNALWFAPLVAALGARRIIALDMPGHGGSTAAPSWEMESIAELMFSASRHLVAGRAIWGGHSWGGKLAAMIAAMHPDTTDALLLLDPSPATGIPIPAEIFVDLTFAGELGPWHSFEEATNSVRNLPQYANWNESLEQAFERGTVRTADGKLRARIPREMLIAICTAAGKDHSDIIRKVSCPTLLAVADESLGWQEAINFGLFPHAMRSVIRSNHWLMSSNPTELNRTVAAWLATGRDEHAREAT
jgi:pimeloyl-ACP methyl ester carboxylesterase